jgi:hypothetical protein
VDQAEEDAEGEVRAGDESFGSAMPFLALTGAA